MTMLRHAALGLMTTLLLAGCAKPPEVMMGRLSPEAPAAVGLPPSPVGKEPTPLLDRSPFGLYAEYPGRDTLTRLSTGDLSPDERYRAAITDQGLWVARKDGAWLWQVPLLPPPPPPTPAQPQVTLIPGQPPPAPAPVTPKATKYLGPLNWTSRGTLLMRDDGGTTVEIHPERASVTQLPYALQGKQDMLFSPDGKQVLYTQPGSAGRQLIVANADGTGPKFLGDNVTGTWDASGKPVVQKATMITPGATAPRDLAPDLRIGRQRE